jgi:2-beta-glucuronyltransferase
MPPKGKIAAIFSYHLYAQRRRGSMHWICDSLRKAGWQVRFITCDFSLITRLKGDRRTEYGHIKGINQLERVDDSLSVGVVFTPWHPVGRAGSFFGRLANFATSRYPWPFGQTIKRFAAGSDLVIVESCGGLLMLDQIKTVTEAPIVYRVSDNLRVVRPVPALLDAERRAMSSADAVSLASEHLARLLKVGDNVRFDPMGLDKTQFDLALTSPYPDDNRVKVVISGSSGLDCDALRLAAESHPEWDFIQFGAASGLPKLPNIIDMGERPFSELVPWVKFADIGFAPYVTKPGFEYQAEHSNRLLQYVYCGLPCVVPEALVSDSKPHFLGYRSGNKASIAAALDAARSFDRSSVPVDSVLDWDQLAARLAGVSKRIAENQAT